MADDVEMTAEASSSPTPVVDQSADEPGPILPGSSSSFLHRRLCDAEKALERGHLGLAETILRELIDARLERARRYWQARAFVLLSLRFAKDGDLDCAPLIHANLAYAYDNVCLAQKEQLGQKHAALLERLGNDIVERIRSHRDILIGIVLAGDTEDDFERMSAEDCVRDESLKAKTHLLSPAQARALLKYHRLACTHRLYGFDSDVWPLMAPEHVSECQYHIDRAAADDSASSSISDISVADWDALSSASRFDWTERHGVDIMHDRRAAREQLLVDEAASKERARLKAEHAVELLAEQSKMAEKDARLKAMEQELEKLKQILATPDAAKETESLLPTIQEDEPPPAVASPTTAAQETAIELTAGQILSTATDESMEVDRMPAVSILGQSQSPPRDGQSTARARRRLADEPTQVAWIADDPELIRPRSRRISAPLGYQSSAQIAAAMHAPPVPATIEPRRARSDSVSSTGTEPAVENATDKSAEPVASSSTLPSSRQVKKTISNVSGHEEVEPAMQRVRIGGAGTGESPAIRSLRKLSRRASTPPSASQADAESKDP